MLDDAPNPKYTVTWLGPDQVSGDYTEEMRQRAFARIANRREKQDSELLHSQYMHIMYGLFMRRLSRLPAGAGVVKRDRDESEVSEKPE